MHALTLKTINDSTGGNEASSVENSEDVVINDVAVDMEIFVEGPYGNPSINVEGASYEVRIYLIELL